MNIDYLKEFVVLADNGSFSGSCGGSFPLAVQPVQAYKGAGTGA